MTMLRKNNPQLDPDCLIKIGEVRVFFLFLSYPIFGFYIVAVDSGIWSRTQSIEQS